MLGVGASDVCVIILSFLIFARAVLNDLKVDILNDIRSPFYNTSEDCNILNNVKKPHITCLILARGGSKGIPLKNLAKLNGVTLLKRTLMIVFEFARTSIYHVFAHMLGFCSADNLSLHAYQLIRAPLVYQEFDSVWVSTDNLNIGKEAVNAGAQVHWRGAETATDTAASLMAVQEFSSFHPEIDVIALIQCTSPFLKASFLEEAYSKMQRGEFDSVFSATREHKLRWKQFPDSSVEPLNFSPKTRPRRQDWDGELVENGMFYFARTSLISHGLLQGGRCGVVEIPKMYSLEVDTAFDLKLATSLDSVT